MSNTYEVEVSGKTQTVKGYNVQNALEKLGIPHGNITHRDGKQYKGRYFAWTSYGRLVWVTWVEKNERYKLNKS